MWAVGEDGKKVGAPRDDQGRKKVCGVFLQLRVGQDIYCGAKGVNRGRADGKLGRVNRGMGQHGISRTGRRYL